MIEIERRFLCAVADPAALAGHARPSRIRQGYLTLDGPAVRIREQDGRFTLAVKAGRGRVRREVEIPVAAAQAAALFEIAGDAIIEKDRYVVGRWEVDLFRARLEGLAIAEIELERAEEGLPKGPAAVRLGREVTDDPEFTNQRLAALSEAEARTFVAKSGAASRR